MIEVYLTIGTILTFFFLPFINILTRRKIDRNHILILCHYVALCALVCVLFPRKPLETAHLCNDRRLVVRLTRPHYLLYVASHTQTQAHVNTLIASWNELYTTGSNNSCYLVLLRWHYRHMHEYSLCVCTRPRYI